VAQTASQAAVYAKGLKKEFLSLSVLLLQRLGVFFMKFSKKKMETGHSLLAKDILQGSSNAYRFIA
jgi:hypothetical protein